MLNHKRAVKSWSWIVVLVFSLAGCGLYQMSAIDNVIAQYQAKADQVQLGDTKDKVLALLAPTQEGLPVNAKKLRESFTDGNDVIEVYFFRSARQPDGLTTDDEFTPYVFRKGILTSIGWTALGGPKTVGTVVPTAPTIIQQPIQQLSTGFTCMQNGPFLNCH